MKMRVIWGAIVTSEPDGASSSQAYMRSIMDPATHILRFVFPADKAVSTIYSEDLTGRLNEQHNCTLQPNDVIVDRNLFHGVRAIHLRRTLHTSTGNLEAEDWKLPDYGCIQAQYFSTEYDENAKVTGVLKNEATSVSLAEPEAAMFEVPPDYKEMSVREIHLNHTKSNYGAEWLIKAPASFVESPKTADPYIAAHKKALEILGRAK